MVGRLLPGGRDRVSVPLSELSRGLSLADFGRAKERVENAIRMKQLQLTRFTSEKEVRNRHHVCTGCFALVSRVYAQGSCIERETMQARIRMRSSSSRLSSVDERGRERKFSNRTLKLIGTREREKEERAIDRAAEQVE